TRILLDDGLLHVEVTRVEPPRVHGRVRYGGTLTSHKGMNLPDVQVSAPSVTEKDRLDIALALEHGADFIGVSFVRRFGSSCLSRFSSWRRSRRRRH
ncbi:MAG: pyruvate kinase, partial [Gemmatimonadales bacterium]